MTLLYVKAVLLDPISVHIITKQSFYIFSKTVSSSNNGCNLVTLVNKSVLGHNGSCTFCGRGVHMPLVFHLFSGLSCSLVQKIKFAAPMYCESHWVSGDVYDAFRGLHVRVARSQFCSHHMPMFTL